MASSPYVAQATATAGVATATDELDAARACLGQLAESEARAAAADGIKPHLRARHLRGGRARVQLEGQVRRARRVAVDELVDDDDRPLPAGELGNLLIRGDSTCAFYWNQHEKSRQTIQGEWIRTGDKYVQDADGYFWFAGRTDDIAHWDSRAPYARQNHPSPEHFLPLPFAMGAAGEGAKAELVHSSCDYGLLMMDTYLFH